MFISELRLWAQAKAKQHHDNLLAAGATEKDMILALNKDEMVSTKQFRDFILAGAYSDMANKMAVEKGESMFGEEVSGFAKFYTDLEENYANLSVEDRQAMDLLKAALPITPIEEVKGLVESSIKNCMITASLYNQYKERVHEIAEERSSTVEVSDLPSDEPPEAA